MVTKEEYAQLSLHVYDIGVDASQDNRPLLPTGWELAEPLHSDGLDGFSYGVFRRTGSSEIVLAYAGTDQGVDWLANVTTAIGASVYIGQDGADTFTGGDKNDMILAGGGADTLNGGTGNDYLYGGTGSDTYKFTDTFGSDVIEGVPVGDVRTASSAYEGAWQ